jgi:hypothetical protein
MNKKGFSNLALLILAFALAVTIYFFSAIFLYEAGGQYLISPVSEIGQGIISDTTIDSVNTTVSATILEVENGYLNFNFPFDLFFLFTWLLAIVGTITLSFKANKEGIFEFFGWLFMGTLILLLITSYVSDFVAWFLVEIFDAVFTTSLISMPIFTYYLTNLGLINFVWWLSLVLINIIDRTIISKTGEAEQ